MNRLPRIAKRTVSVVLCAGMIAGIVALLAWAKNEYLLPPSPSAYDRNASKRDIYLLVVDTLRADHTSTYGYRQPTSPELDQFAKSALRFENVISASSWTLPSLGSIFTSTYSSTHGLLGHVGDGSVTTLNRGLATLAETLRGTGYRTVAISTNPWFLAEHGLLRGFDESVLRPWRDAAFVHRVARSVLAQEDPRPLFLFLHYMDVHGPYNTPRDAVDLPTLPSAPSGDVLTDAEISAMPKYLRIPGATRVSDYEEAYDRGIRYWDMRFGEWLRWLEREDLRDDAILSVLSDHGEEFHEHGGWSHGESVYQEQIQVPWLISAPEVRPETVDKTWISTLDVAPTLLDLAGVSVPSSMEGRALTDSTTQLGDRIVFSETAVPYGGEYDPSLRKVAAIAGSRKLIRTSRSDCFDLQSDPEEKSPIDLAEGCASLMKPAGVLWEGMARGASESEGSIGSRKLDAEALEALRALGYLN